MPSRRQFLAGLTLAAAARGRADEPKSADVPKPAFPTRVLGKTGLRVPILEVGGTYRFNKRYVERALELGCNFFDTAAVYVNGWSESTLGQAVNALDARKRVIVVTKGHATSPERLEAAVDESLKRLRFDSVDIYYLHNLSDAGVLTDRAWATAVDALKRKGKLRFFGFSTHNEHTVPLLNNAAKSGFVDVAMLKYNFRSYGDRELNSAIDVAHKAGVGLIAMKTQGSAVSFLERVNPFQQAGFSKHQAVLKAVWKDERLASAVSHMPSIQVLEHNAAAAAEKLSRAEEGLLEKYAADTRGNYCAGGCGGCRRECETATGGRLAIADTLRFLMYHDSYGQRSTARAEFRSLPDASKLFSDNDLRLAAAACPNGLRVTELIRQAERRLS